MEKPLIKLYIIMIAAIVLAIVFIPVIIGRTSACANELVVDVSLIAYQSKEEEQKLPDTDKGNVVIIMDDNWETQYTAGYKILKDYSMKANIGVIPSAVGKQGYMNYEQLADLYMDGWDLLSHTYNHVNLTELDEKQQEEQITNCRDWLYGHKLSRGSDILIYPGGNFNDTTINILKKQGFSAARSLKSVWLAEIDCTLEDVDICNIISDISMKRIRAALDKAADNRATVIFLLHKIEPVTDDTGMQVDEEKFKNIIDLIEGYKSKLNVITMSELIASEKENYQEFCA